MGKQASTLTIVIVILVALVVGTAAFALGRMQTGPGPTIGTATSSVAGVGDVSSGAGIYGTSGETSAGSPRTAGAMTSGSPGSSGSGSGASGSSAGSGSSAANTYAGTPPISYAPIPSAGQPAPPGPTYATCTANDLTGTAGWQGADGALTGAIRVRNSSDHACSFPHDGRVTIYAGPQALLVSQSYGRGAEAGVYTDLSPGQSAYVWFSWSNWCGAGTGYPDYVRLTLPNAGYLHVPLIDAAGRPQSDVPRCADPTSSSVVSVWY